MAPFGEAITSLITMTPDLTVSDGDEGGSDGVSGGVAGSSGLGVGTGGATEFSSPGVPPRGSNERCHLSPSPRSIDRPALAFG